MMKLQKAKREKVKLRIGLSGTSGSGKTYSALLIAKGLAGSWDKVALVDTEFRSSLAYADPTKPWEVLHLEAPFSPEAYIEAIETCEKSDISVVILDSVSNEWEGKGGCLEICEKLGGKFSDWAKVTPRHRAFLDKILQSSCHIITTTRRKTDYAMETTANGKAAPKKIGLKEIQRDGFEYELTTAFDIDSPSHLAKASKDRTGLFMEKPHFVITEEVGKDFLGWSQGGAEETYQGTNMQKTKIIEKVKAKGLNPSSKAITENLKSYSEANIGKELALVLGPGLDAATILWAQGADAG